jgi:hypothetical protein
MQEKDIYKKEQSWEARVRRKWQSCACYSGELCEAFVLSVILPEMQLGSFPYNKVKGKPRTPRILITT